MNKFKQNFSKKNFTLLFVLFTLISSIQTLCPDGTQESQAVLDCIASINVDGEFCRAAFINDIPVAQSFTDKTAYCCSVNGVYDSNPFFQKMPASPGTCNFSVSLCFGQGEDIYHVIAHSHQSGSTVCRMRESERCYRNNNFMIEPDFSSIFGDGDSAIDTDTLEDCCHSECNDLYSVNAIGCGSDGIFYNNVGDFCNEFCDNRTLKLVECGESYEGINCINHAQCPSICEQNAEDRPSCGSDGLLYADKQSLCAAFDSGIISSYNQCEAPNGCLAVECIYNKCMQDLAELNYQGPQICGSSGMFYDSLDDFCTAMAQDSEYFFSLCDDGPCADQLSCCLRVCNNGNDTFSTYCDNNFNFYDNKAAYCDAFCGGGISETLCGGDHCSGEGCCVAECINDNPHDVCHKISGQVWSAEHMCQSEGCSGNISNLATQCFNSLGVVVNCTQVDCDVMHCEETMLNDGGERNICGDNGASYPTIESYCNALHRTNTIEYEVLCNGGSCPDQATCCNAHCNQVTFAGGYQERCNNQFESFLNSESYCSEYCVNDSFASLMCNGELCSLVECCQQNCVNTQNFAVCSADFQLITGTSNCQSNCQANGGVIYECAGVNCVQDDCDFFKCLNLTLVGYPDNVCLKHNDSSFSFTSKEAVCQSIVSGIGGTPFMCENCGDQSDCATAYCALEINITDVICDLNFNIYTDGIEYCGANGNNLTLIQDCGGVPCDHRECCFKKCETEILYSACNKDHFYVMTTEERCHFRCGNQHIDRADLVVDLCYNDIGVQVDCPSCDEFRCHADFEGYAYNTICINQNGASSFYASINLYCDFLIGTQVDVFNWEMSITCSGDECADFNACCVAACEINQAQGFLEYCNLDGYSVVTLHEHCQSVCGITSITNTHFCGTDNCQPFDCEIERCKLEANNLESTICLNTIFHGNYFYASVDSYCDVAVNQQEPSYSVVQMEYTCTLSNCPTKDDCCYERCLTESYISSCNAQDHTVILQDAFCNHRCYNNDDRNDMVLDICHDNTGQIPCTSCELFNCEDQIIALGYNFQTICINNNDTSLFFSAYLEFCEHLIFNMELYEINNDNTCGGNGCADENECCMSVCMSLSFQPGCDSSYNFFNQSQYCTAHCEGNAPTLTLCGDQDCSEDVCYFRKCMDVIRPVYHEMCLKDSVSNVHFFESKADYCNAKVLAQQVDFTNFDEIFCVNEGRCESVAECCHFRCTEEDYMDGCHTTLHHLVDQEQFCQFRCDESHPTEEDMDLLACDDGNGSTIPCTANQCSFYDCADYLEDDNNYIGVGVCSTADIFYVSHFDFCQATNGDITLIKLCPDVNNIMVGCGNDDQCCMSNCLEMQNYSPQCNTTDYIWRTTLQSYCENYCQNGRTFDAYMDNEGNLASQEMCCSMRCVDDNADHHDVCNAGDFTIIDQVGTCQHLCENPSGLGIISCPGTDCQQSDCDHHKCLQQLTNIMYVSNNICGNDGSFYTRESYCESIGQGNNVNLVLCGSSPCADPAACCQANCVNDYIGPFQEMCDLNFNVFTNVEDYCMAKCTNPGVSITPLLCNGNNCSLNECCKQECMSEAYLPMCSPQPECELMDHQTYCNNKCDQVDFAPMTCENQANGCAQSNCDYFECIFAVDLVHEDNQVCGSNSFFYNNEVEYCTNKVLGNVDNFYLCEGGICESDYECCYHVCLEENQDSYNPRCSNTFILYETVENFCNAKCSIQDYGDLMCGDMYCTALECCSLDCQNQPYAGHCDGNFNFLSHSAYCDSSCAEIDSIINCDGGCTETKCKQLSCENNLETRQIDTICIDPPYNGFHFFISNSAFCGIKIMNNDDVFLVSNEVNCMDENQSEIACADGQECCVARCLQTYQYNVCSSTYDIITPDVFCSNYCGGTPLQGVRTCEDNQGNSVHCNTCDNFLCLDLTVNITGTICATSLTNSFHQNATFFCNHVINNSLDVQVMFDSIVLCDGGPCLANSCCIAVCEMEYAPSFFNSCNIDNYTVYDLRDHCTEECSVSSINTQDCGANNNCVLDDCLMMKCEAEANPVFGPGICLPNHQGLRFFFSNLNDYCDHLVSNQITPYDASSSISCGLGSCNNSYNCCYNRCFMEDYINGCNPTTWTLVGKDTFCDYRCENNPTEALSYTDMSLFTCHAQGSGQIPCTQQMCNMERCAGVFSAYGFTSLCLSNDFTQNYYFASLTLYCDHLLSLPNPIYVLPDFITCNGNQNCNNQDDCCFARCMGEAYLDGCHTVNYLVVPQNEFCSHRCSATNQNRVDLQMDTCGQQNCTSCEIFKCTDVISGAANNICLYVFSGIEYFYTSHVDYCEAKINANQTDYALTLNNYLDCENSPMGCTSSEDCCKYKCKEQSFHNVCRASDFSLVVDEDEYCYVICEADPLAFHACYDNFNSQIDCNAVSCCEFQVDSANNFDPVCSSLGDLYDNSFTFCQERVNNNPSLTELTCNGGECSVDTCHKEFCYNFSSEASLVFPRCDNLYTHHANVQSFCDAQFLNSSLTLFSSCVGGSCDPIDCCLLQCSDNPTDASNDAVVFLVNGGALVFENACIAACNGHTEIVFTCPDMGTDECLTLYQNSCHIHCEMYQSHTETYCGNGLFYTAYEYCQYIECDALPTSPSCHSPISRTTLLTSEVNSESSTSSITIIIVHQTIRSTDRSVIGVTSIHTIGNITLCLTVQSIIQSITSKDH